MPLMKYEHVLVDIVYSYQSTGKHCSSVDNCGFRVESYRLHCTASHQSPTLNPLKFYVRTTELERSRKCSYYSEISGRAQIRVPPAGSENVCLPHTAPAWRDGNNFLQKGSARPNRLQPRLGWNGALELGQNTAISDYYLCCATGEGDRIWIKFTDKEENLFWCLVRKINKVNRNVKMLKFKFKGSIAKLKKHNIE